MKSDIGDELQVSFEQRRGLKYSSRVIEAQEFGLHSIFVKRVVVGH